VNLLFALAELCFPIERLYPAFRNLQNSSLFVK